MGGFRTSVRQTQTQPQVQKVHQVKIENRRFSFKQQYFQLLFHQSPLYVMLHNHFTTRRISVFNHRTIDSFNNRNIE